MAKRTAEVERTTGETAVRVRVDLDGEGSAELDCGVPFFEHMLAQVARHGGLDLHVQAKGDTWIDDHHTVEDVGIALGQALARAWGDKAGLTRYGYAYVPLDEALSRAVLDLSGRPGLVYEAEFPRALIGRFDTELVEEFFRALTSHAAVTAHLDVLRGRNAHHMVECLFKAFGRALRQAVSLDERAAGRIPSTKGAL
ncbi:MAG: imidazoleglycerol-phosphate dehydratase HisB [Halorhodospira halophila]|uniref:imidazoleglycerol-phosphate dehydratase HisB n=1 Tax=Halorhodospira TaxID=85108 RepID=UPI0019114CD3|nr:MULTISPECIES: imidazoleglycerol-phosphate dehydratase HisB [Halorhodospira]MBK5935764.1 imidazoleglycerol-phosphate dehydratase [Halorhodospira halophila]MBK5943472.1 imidazoleglycerol-phosphate dehydratase [Halorhodospira halophila]MCC3751555.1 imidazoleglycerol-phosphate dehydratase HisB [Halorhodospira halophila]MCG5527002.1 imidazoleglycerol-phosphate dehydratase HisB [Halorhodospira halophila]MCG5532377.1 imidazoleglycerol-phosphate dehydratase HisB [Halorhodospira sp. 9621]